MNTPAKLLTGATIGGAVAISALSLMGAGSLTPPAAPAPTMKSLDEVEARIPISSAPFTVSASGSYYLTGNLSVTTDTAVIISADDVLLDLNGFTISSTASPMSGTGVLISGTRHNVVIRNGIIKGSTTYSAGTFTTGGFVFGLFASDGTNVRVGDVTVRGVGDAGIGLSAAINSCTVERCMTEVCGGTGISAGSVKDCTAVTSGGDGIAAGSASDSFGESVGAAATDNGIVVLKNVQNCRGVASAGSGVEALQAMNCTGTSSSGTGLVAQNATNCEGISTSGTGLTAENATNCFGGSTSGAFGLNILGTASFCRAQRNGGTAIVATIAIGCTVNGTGTVTSGQKHLGTP